MSKSTSLFLLFSVVFSLGLSAAFTQNTSTPNKSRDVKTVKEKVMGKEEFEILLVGNTMIGVWVRSPYEQYFSDAGTTLYVSDGSRSTGTWRIRDDGTYCSGLATFNK
ncbi:MAG: hypothetical protein ACRCYY_09765 [Trueperaceae bacterium]